MNNCDVVSSNTTGATSVVLATVWFVMFEAHVSDAEKLMKNINIV